MPQYAQWILSRVAGFKCAVKTFTPWYIYRSRSNDNSINSPKSTYLPITSSGVTPLERTANASHEFINVYIHRSASLDATNTYFLLQATKMPYNGEEAICHNAPKPPMEAVKIYFTLP
jgi:hypothetical protein